MIGCFEAEMIKSFTLTAGLPQIPVCLPVQNLCLLGRGKKGGTFFFLICVFNGLENPMDLL